MQDLCKHLADSLEFTKQIQSRGIQATSLRSLPRAVSQTSITSISLTVLHKALLKLATYRSYMPTQPPASALGSETDTVVATCMRTVRT